MQVILTGAAARQAKGDDHSRDTLQASFHTTLFIFHCVSKFLLCLFNKCALLLHYTLVMITNFPASANSITEVDESIFRL